MDIIKENNRSVTAGFLADINDYLTPTNVEIIKNEIENVKSSNANALTEDEILAMDNLELSHAVYNDPTILPKYGYYYDISMPEYAQDYVRMLCFKTGVPYKAVFAILEQESHFQTGIISSTDDYGAPQINKYWFGDIWLSRGWSDSQIQNEWIPSLDMMFYILVNDINYYNYNASYFRYDNIIGYYHQHINWRNANDGVEYVELVLPKLDHYPELTDEEYEEILSDQSLTLQKSLNYE